MISEISDQALQDMIETLAADPDRPAVCQVPFRDNTEEGGTTWYHGRGTTVQQQRPVSVPVKELLAF